MTESAVNASPCWFDTTTVDAGFRAVNASEATCRVLSPTLDDTILITCGRYCTKILVSFSQLLKIFGDVTRLVSLPVDARAHHTEHDRQGVR